MDKDPVLREGLFAYARTGDSTTYRNLVLTLAQAGNLGAELLLAQQYVPAQCTFEPDQDEPYCGKHGDQPPRISSRRNPLGLEPSYEEAARWFEKASAQDCGEASEELAQMITRMQANGHSTRYTAADADHFYALARSQGFDLEPLRATCYKLAPGGTGTHVEPRRGSTMGEPASPPFTAEELAALERAGVTGSLRPGGSSQPGESVLLMRPEGPVIRIRVILDHDPGREVLLPIPAHHDAVYVQRGETFVAMPSEGGNLSRFVALEATDAPAPQILVYTQGIGGGYTGGFCARFP